MLRYQWPALLWAVVILVLCNMKMPVSSGEGIFFVGFDKMVHLGFFFVLAVLLLHGKVRRQQHYGFNALTILKLIAVSAIFGALIELLQWKVFTYRSAEWWDFGCDLIGCLMAAASYILLHQSNYHEQNS